MSAEGATQTLRLSIRSPPVWSRASIGRGDYLAAVRWRAIKVNKTYIPSLVSLPLVLLADHSGGLRLLGRKTASTFCLPSALRAAWESDMKLFRMAFWLGVVIFNLPNPAPRPDAPESQLGGRDLAAKAASQLCSQPLGPSATIVSKRGERGWHNSSVGAVKPSQDTLAPADRAVPWCGSVLHKGPMEKG
jgi:hypothetical protein